MKISKLFHWLYAILMLLPFVFFVPSVLYYAFNDNATMQTIEVPKTETVAVDFNQVGNDGNFEEDWLLSPYVTATFDNNLADVVVNNPNVTQNQLYLRSLITPTINHVYLIKYNFTLYEGNLNFGSGYAGNYSTGDTAAVLNTNIEYSRRFRANTTDAYQYIYFWGQSGKAYVSNFMMFDLTQMFGIGNEPTIIEFNQLFPNSYYSYTESELMQITYDTGETEQLVQNTDIVNYAWESIWNLPLFSWSKISFVAVPFTYITGLFGLSASNSLNYVFTYFASISIIWLVFDVLLYVPLLTHRWLDKGIVE